MADARCIPLCPLRLSPFGRDGEIIAASQDYESKASAEKGIEAIKTHAAGAAVEDHSD